MKSWLMLRGESKNHFEVKKTYDEDSDLYLTLFNDLCHNGDLVWFNDADKKYKPNKKWLLNRDINVSCKTNYDIITSTPEFLINHIKQPDIIFARGAFDFYLPILKAWKDSYIIRYSSGNRYIPEPGINYNLILCDSGRQKKEILQKYPKVNVHLFIKPAAQHFKPIECEKIYDVCLIANETQGHFKGIQWVYDTIPKDLKVLHLGNFTGRYKAPENVTRKHVSRIKMPEYINMCKIGIVPYWNQIDSTPRIISEQLACGLPLVVADELNFWREKYKSALCSKQNFWKEVIDSLRTMNSFELLSKGVTKDVVVEDYKENLSIPIAAKHIHNLIETIK